MDVGDEVKALIKTVTSREVPVTDTDTLDDLNLDSLEQVELLAAIEDRFGIEIPVDDYEKVGTVGTLTRYLQDRTGKK